MKVLVIILLIARYGFGQGIWKDYREMGVAERQEYIKVLNQLNTNGVRQNFIDSHTNYAQHSFSGPNNNFLPWHRMMLYYFGREAKAVNRYFNQGYLDWYTTNLSTSILLKNSSNGSVGLLGLNVDWVFTRGINNTTSNSFRTYSVNIAPNTLSDFANTLETNPHNNGHGILAVGGSNSMSQVRTAPADPVFYFHHAMVDKVWADWVKLKWNGTDFGNVTNGNVNSLNSTSNYNGRLIFDPRALKLWYAENKNVVLDNYTASNQTLGITTGNEFYFYTDTIKSSRYCQSSFYSTQRHKCKNRKPYRNSTFTRHKHRRG